MKNVPKVSKVLNNDFHNSGKLERDKCNSFFSECQSTEMSWLLQFFGLASQPVTVSCGHVLQVKLATECPRVISATAGILHASYW